MWYVIQVMSGREGQTVLLMERILSDGILESCFVPMRKMKKKYHGEWREITEKLFPGYVFLISGQPRLLYDELKNIPALTKLLGSCEEYFTPLSEGDVELLGRLREMQDKKQEQEIERRESKESKVPEVGVSQVVVGEERKIRIVSGPLKNLKGQIRKINLHKRIAVVETEFMGNQTRIHLGIEIVSGE